MTAYRAAAHGAGTATHRSDLDGLRGVAILLVFAVHSLPHELPGGFVGVDVFFVLSGYLIALNTLRALDGSGFRPGAFYLSRLRRLGPALVLVLAACLLAAALLLWPRDARALGQHVAAGAAFITNLVLWREAGYFDASSELKPLLHLWSLGVEAQFYLAWPLLALLWQRAPRWRSASVAVLLLASLLLNVAWVEAKPKGVFFLPPTRFWELLVGAQLACWQHAPGARRVPPVLSALGLGLLLLALALIDKHRNFPGWWALLPTLGTALIIAAGPQALPNRTLLSHPLVMFYGRISYPLYLWHWPLLVLPKLAGWSLDPMAQAAMLVLAVALAALTTYGVEQPLRSARWAPWSARCSGAGLVLVAGMGLLLYWGQGWPGRLPREPQQVARVHADTDYPSYRIESCFLRSEQGPESFAAICRSGQPAAAPEWLLWGDSHAAALWPGLAPQAQARGLRLTQWTAAACPPGWQQVVHDNAHCAAINQHVFAAVAAQPPHTVLLAARWQAEPAEAGAAGRNRAKVLADTVAQLRRLGVQDVVVLGPLPHWREEAPRLALQGWRREGELPPWSAAVDSNAAALDATLQQEARAAGARWASPLQALCDSSACRLMVPNASGQVMAFDRSHLTAAGSRWLVEALAGALWSPAP